MRISFTNINPAERADYMHILQKNEDKTSFNKGTISFNGISADKKTLRELAKYGLKDMYTGEDMLHSDVLEGMLRSGLFTRSISAISQSLNKKRNLLTDTAIKYLNEIEKLSKKNPNVSLSEANQMLGKKHEKILINIQQPIFEKLIKLSTQMPKNLKEDFSKLLNETDLRLSRQRVTVPFSARTFLYQLKNFAKQVESKNNKKEILAMRLIIRNAQNIFRTQILESKTGARKKLSKEEKLRRQMQPAVLQENTMKYDVLYSLFSTSVLRRNKELDRIFKNASAMMHGAKLILPFKRQEFIYDLKKITAKLKDKKLAAEIIKVAHELPQSCDNVSAFVVKHLDSNNNRIGFYWLKDSLCSIDHMKALNIGGKNKLANMGLCRAITNTHKTDIPFDEWCRMYPGTYLHIPNHVEQLKTMQAEGIYKKIGLNAHYTDDVISTIEELSPQERPIIIKR